MNPVSLCAQSVNMCKCAHRDVSQVGSFALEQVKTDLGKKYPTTTMLKEL